MAEPDPADPELQGWAHDPGSVSRHIPSHGHSDWSIYGQGTQGGAVSFCPETLAGTTEEKALLPLEFLSQEDGSLSTIWKKKASE